MNIAFSIALSKTKFANEQPATIITTQADEKIHMPTLVIEGQNIEDCKAIMIDAITSFFNDVEKSLQEKPLIKLTHK